LLTKKRDYKRQSTLTFVISFVCLQQKQLQLYCAGMYALSEHSPIVTVFVANKQTRLQTPVYTDDCNLVCLLATETVTTGLCSESANLHQVQLANQTKNWHQQHAVIKFFTI